jgi:hypothetical protein
MKERRETSSTKNSLIPALKRTRLSFIAFATTPTPFHPFLLFLLTHTFLFFFFRPLPSTSLIDSSKFELRVAKLF